MNNSFNEDVTNKVTEYFMTLVKEFYFNPSNKGKDILMYWQQCQNQCMRGWKKIIMQHYPYNFNEHLARCTDVSKRKIERISLKN